MFKPVRGNDAQVAIVIVFGDDADDAAGADIKGKDAFPSGLAYPGCLAACF
jgi:hypothetical protein